MSLIIIFVVESTHDIFAITMPANTFVIGKRHKTSHFNIILKGKAHVLIDGVVSIVEAPCI